MKKDKKQNKVNDTKKLNGKDIAIVVLSAVALIMMIAIILVSKRRDQQVFETLETQSEVTADEVVATLSGDSRYYLMITEVSSDKWIEIHNTGAEAIDMSGIEVLLGGEVVASLEDGKSIGKGEYLAVDITRNPGFQDVNVLTIRDKDGETLKAMLVPKLTKDQSFGICDEESNVWGFMNPSKAAENSDKADKYIAYDGISFSAPGGFYDSGFTLEVSADEGETLYYTIDGTTPTVESEKYEDGIKIANRSGSNYVYAEMAMDYKRGHNYFPGAVDQGTVVSVIAVNAKGEITKTTSQSYFVGLTRDSDYLNIPVLSVTTDPVNLFDYAEGIYVAGKGKEDALIMGESTTGKGNYYNRWKKQAKVEYYEPNKDKTFEAAAQMSISVDYQTTDRQKNLIFDLGDLKTDSFKGSSILDYISAAGTFEVAQSGDDNNLKLRNYIVNAMTSDLGVGTLDIRPCVVFIDGEYWGLYSLKADYDEAYVERHYGISSDDVIIKKKGGSSSRFTEMYNFVTTADLSDSENYQKAEAMVDIDNYIDYICFNMFFANSSFEAARGAAWRTVSTDGEGLRDGKWRFLTGDMGATMADSDLQTGTINSFLQPAVTADLMLQSFLMNKEFCSKLEKEMERIVSQKFTEDKWSAAIDELVDYLKKPAAASSTRFYGNINDTQYETEIETIEEFLRKRPDYILTYAKELAQKGGDMEKAREILAKQKKTDTDIAGEAASDAGSGESSQGSSNEDSNTEGNTNG